MQAGRQAGSQFNYCLRALQMHIAHEYTEIQREREICERRVFTHQIVDVSTRSAPPNYITPKCIAAAPIVHHARTHMYTHSVVFPNQRIIGASNWRRKKLFDSIYTEKEIHGKEKKERKIQKK